MVLNVEISSYESLGIPFLGNLPFIPRQHSWLAFIEQSSQYRPIFRLNLAGHLHYVVSTEKIANDLLRERGNIYSSREQLPAAAQLLSGGLRPLLLPYNEMWRSGRKIMHTLTMAKTAKTYESTQAMESTRLLESLIAKPEDYERWFERYASGLMFRLAFGRRIITGQEPEVRRIYKVLENLERVASPGAYLVDVFPILMKLPRGPAPFKCKLEALQKEELLLFRKLRDDIRADVQAGTGPDCWEKVAVQNEQNSGLTADQLAYVIGTIFEAGSGTTAAAMMSFILCMVLHPDKQSKLQQEVDTVVGSEKMPSFEDISRLPFIRAVMKETLRWRPVTAGGIPHLVTHDDTYDGLYIPAGTNIPPNQWAIHHDPSLYPSPESYIPERSLLPKYPTFKEPLTLYPNLQGFSTFGLGRRICPGINIAERSLNLLVARIAWACKIDKKYDENGRLVDVLLYDYTHGFNAQPKRSAFALRARGIERQRIIALEARKARDCDPLKGQGVECGPTL